MKKIFKIALVLMVIALLVSGCSTEKNDNPASGDVTADYALNVTDRPSNLKEGSSVAEGLLNVFEENKDKGFDGVCEALANSDFLKDLACEAFDNEGPYLNGFNHEAEGFSKCKSFYPMIGSVPFVMHVFEADDVSHLMKELNDHVDTRWNICTEADQMLMKSEGNLVFVVMAPWSFD